MLMLMLMITLVSVIDGATDRALKD